MIEVEVRGDLEYAIRQLKKKLQNTLLYQDLLLMKMPYTGHAQKK